ncbi:hypothetical protein [[Kitasatospora] papulosa]|uniref:hypothetical protein n=1 Tax=[Kitasatospora] papulosa TaxID=1464011 RepID=UPI0036A39FEE
MVGLGHVGLPTALSLHAAGHTVVGVDTSGFRPEAIRSGRVDLLPSPRSRLTSALHGTGFRLTAGPAADAVVVVDGGIRIERAALRVPDGAHLDGGGCGPGTVRRPLRRAVRPR